MSAFAYVGNPEDAAGFRLAGVRCWTPNGDEAQAFAAALASGAEAVFVTTAVAQRIPPAAFESALAAGRPLLALMPEPVAPPSRLDPAERVRAQLGLDA